MGFIPIGLMAREAGREREKPLGDWFLWLDGGKQNGMVALRDGSFILDLGWSHLGWGDHYNYEAFLPTMLKKPERNDVRVLHVIILFTLARTMF